MTNTTTSKGPLRIPCFVTALNGVAERAGFSTEIGVGKLFRNDKADRILTTWRGKPKDFDRLEFLPPSLRRRIRTVGGGIGWPDQNEDWHPVLYGHAEITRREIEVKVSGGPIPKSIRANGGVQIIEYADETAYHGTKEALIAGGVCQEKQFPGKHISRSRHYCGSESSQWTTKRFPDGSYVHWVETEAAREQRCSEYHQLHPGRKADQEDNRTEHKSPEEWLEEFEDMIVTFARVYLSAKYCTVKTKAGMRYSVNPAHLSAILNDIECAAQRIRDVPVKVESLESATPEARDKAASASSDAQFQRFLQRAAGH